jgi:hypothetical protein
LYKASISKIMKRMKKTLKQTARGNIYKLGNGEESVSAVTPSEVNV